MKNLYDKSLKEKDSYKKGLLFEDFVVSFFAGIEGFKVVERRLITRGTDLDVVILNNRSDEPFRSLGSIIVVQAKNYNEDINENVVIEAVEKQGTLYGKLGNTVILAVTSRLNDNARIKVREVNKEEKVLLIPIEKDDWERLWKEDISCEELFKDIIIELPRKYR